MRHPLNDYERIGQEEGLRRIVTDFIQRVYNDSIIGFFFAQIDQAQLIEREIEFASRHLGGPHTYQGKPLAQAHQPHPINLGHFHRRIWLLEQTLKDHHVPDELIQRWLDHDRQLAPIVTNNTACNE